eukprot:393296-Rhodomonas_salina.2
MAELHGMMATNCSSDEIIVKKAHANMSVRGLSLDPINHCRTRKTTTSFVRKWLSSTARSIKTTVPLDLSYVLRNLQERLVVMCNWTADQASKPFEEAHVNGIPFRDASPAEFFLSLKDSISGLWKAKAEGWLSTPLNWWESRALGDLHRVCPNFVAYRGPVADEALLHLLALQVRRNNSECTPTLDG